MSAVSKFLSAKKRCSSLRCLTPQSVVRMLVHHLRIRALMTKLLSMNDARSTSARLSSFKATTLHYSSFAKS